MIRTDIVHLTAVLAKDIKEAQTEALDKLNGSFTPSTKDNEQAHKQFNMHTAMGQFMLVSGLNSTYKKAYDSAKELLDNEADALGLSTNMKDGEDRTVFQNNMFSFVKKRNKGGETTSIKDFIIELNKMGVEKDTIEKAFENATKPKKGSVYYSVTLVD